MGGLFTVLKYIDNKKIKKGHVNFMKSQTNFIKNINNNLTLIKVVFNLELHDSMINNYWRKYEGGNRVYSTNFFTPEVMSHVLQLLTEN